MQNLAQTLIDIDTAYEAVRKDIKERFAPKKSGSSWWEKIFSNVPSTSGRRHTRSTHYHQYGIGNTVDNSVNVNLGSKKRKKKGENDEEEPSALDAIKGGVLVLGAIVAFSNPLREAWGDLTMRSNIKQWKAEVKQVRQKDKQHVLGGFSWALLGELELVEKPYDDSLTYNRLRLATAALALTACITWGVNLGLYRSSGLRKIRNFGLFSSCITGGFWFMTRPKKNPPSLAGLMDSKFNARGAEIQHVQLMATQPQRGAGNLYPSAP